MEPLRARHTEYVFMGRDIDMRIASATQRVVLALLLAFGKGVSEIPFHAAYLLSPLTAAFQRAGAPPRRFVRIRYFLLCSFCAPHQPLSSIEHH